MRSSAYQFFQLIRRVTNPLAPSKVANLYHELRRLSRLWRWVKKLRWAGYAQRVGQPITPNPGQLGNYCPACPQIGINVAANWLSDPNRWVYRRIITADGNFKADHVRQNSSADDVWLSDGLGMTTRKSDYSSFLETPWDRATVSLNKSHFFPLAQLIRHRKHHVKLISKLLRMLCSSPKHATLQELWHVHVLGMAASLRTALSICFAENSKRTWTGPCWKQFGLLMWIQGRA